MNSWFLKNSPAAGTMANRPAARRKISAAAMVLAAGAMLIPAGPARAQGHDADVAVAMQLADLLRAGRTVISRNQDLINDPDKADKGLTAERVLDDALGIYVDRTGTDPRESDPDSREGRLLRAQMEAMVAVMDENQATINTEGVGFKGFIPAIFARLVNEKFGDRVGDEAQIKVTAPENLVRNRKARPDEWETSVLEDKFKAADWPKGQAFSDSVSVDGRPAFRIIVPEYYSASCLSCHGEPAGEVDITGYPKEGGQEGDLGAAISITLFE